METDVRWHHGQTLAAGQVAEFKVWAELVRQSRGALHVFLPLRDLGIDGVLHRLGDGAYVALQVKGRTSLTAAGQVHITVTASSLVDDEALIIATLIDGSELGRFVLVVTEAEFRRLAAHDLVDGREYLTAAFELHAGGESRWAPFLVDREALAERFGAMGLGLERPAVETREVGSGHFLGLQVKTAGWDVRHREERIYFRRSSFRAAASTFICVLGWNRDSLCFADDILLIPSADVAGIARAEGEWWVLEVAPGGARHRRLDRYRVALASLGS